jgi:hypothetical protein
MNCADVGKALREPLLPLQAREHLQNCKSCQELVSAFNSPVVVDAPSPATLRHIAESIAIDLRAVRPMAPAGYFFGAFMGIFVSIAALAVYRMGAHAIAVMTSLQTGAILGALAVSTGLLTYSVVQQMVPGSRHRIPPRLLPVVITISLTIAIVVLFQFKLLGTELGLSQGGHANCSPGRHSVLADVAPRRSAFSGHDRSGRRAARGAGWDQCAGNSLPQPGCMAYSDIAPRRCDAMRSGRPRYRTGGRRQGLGFELPLSTDHKGD